MANGNMFAGFMNANQARSNALGGAVNALAQGWQNQRNKQAVEAKQQRALGYLVKASELSGQDDAASEQKFMQAYQEDPEFITQLLQAQKARRESIGGPQGQSTAAMKEYQLAKQQGFEGSFLDYQNQAKGGAGKTSQQRNFEQYQALKESSPEDAEAFGKAAGFIDDSGNELSVHLQKRLSTATDTAMASRNASDTMSALADDIEGADFGGGLFGGSWGEAFKRATGNEDAESELRRKYYAIRGSQVVKNLPPGAASDKDIELALAGFPNDNANAKTIASFLRGVAKLEAYNADYNDFAAEYISTNGTERGMIKAWKETGKSAADAYITSGENVIKWDDL